MTATGSADAFALLADETRLAIVEALVAAARKSPRQPGLTFSELRDRTGVRDSGQFNYHLDKLVGRFVEKTDDEYELSYAGMRVAGAILSGFYGFSTDSVGGEQLGPCPVCGSPLEVTYESGLFRFGCDRDHAFADLVPPRIFEDRDVETVVDQVAIAAVGRVRQAQHGACPLCFGHVEWSMVETACQSPGPSDVAILGQCRTCGVPYSAPPGTFAMWDPTVQSTLRTWGIDVWDDPAHWLITGEQWTIETRDVDAGRATVSIDLDAGSMTATVNERGAVVELSTDPA